MSRAVLVIEDETVLAKNIRLFLERRDMEVRVTHTAEEGIAALDLFRPDAVVLDFNLPGMDGMEALARIRKVAPDVKIIMITGHGSVELAVDAMKAGAYDFLTKPVALAKLNMLLDKALDDSLRDSALDYYQRREGNDSGLEKLIGTSPPMQRLKETLTHLLEAEANLLDAGAPAVLVLGETGTGKELVARALHFNGPRRAQPFVELNCASIPSQLLESELFGHERGAFTDARDRKLGLVETAEGGTLFLDEIGDMDPALQAKLLKLLEEKTLRRIGGLRDQKVNVRIVAATHRSLDALVRTGTFRADLFYRLRVVELSVPPLRDRGEDIDLLTGHFLTEHARRYGKPVPTLSDNARRLLATHPWPGNVRELRNVIEQAVLLARNGHISADQLAIPHAADPAPGTGSAGPVGTTLAEIERDTLQKALNRTDWNVSKAARELGVTRDTLRYRIDKLQLAPPHGSDPST